MKKARAAAAPPTADIAWVMRKLRHALPDHDEPAVEKIAEKEHHDPFHVLISTLLSARTQDATTLAASQRLFGKVNTPQAMAHLTVRQIERLIYPVSFYRNKAIHVKATCVRLLERYGGIVPDTMEELTTLPGVGRKTANLVMILAYRSRRNICVDTHVHRISNRLGWVSTRTPEKTEQALYRTVPKRWWPDVNLYLVTWGQHVCRPIGPRCRACVLAARCPRVGVRIRGRE
jgi:endonuclease-3